MDEKQEQDNLKLNDPEAMEEIQFSELHVDGDTYTTLLSPKYRNKKPPEIVNKKQVKAFIPGMIRKVFVKEGQHVKKGEKLCSLEAMKMMNEITTSIDGIVKTIHCKAGVNVANHQVLIELEKIEVKKKKR